MKSVKDYMKDDGMTEEEAQDAYESDIDDTYEREKDRRMGL